MTVKELFVADLQATLEETANLMADKVILEALAKHGKLTLEEAEFYNTLVQRVVTEAAEEFVPDTLNVEQYLQEAGEPMILTGEDGTVYSFDPATCELTPIEGTEADEEPDVADMGEGAEMQEPQMESTEETGDLVEEAEADAEADAEAEAETLTESEEAEAEELTESQMIVSNLIKSLGA